MKQRSLGKMFLLFIVTFGIYRLYWFAKTRKEMLALGSKAIPSILVFVIPVILLVATVILIIVTSIGTAAEVRNQCGPTDTSPAYLECKRNITNDADSILPLISFYAVFFLFWPITIWWLWKYSQAVEQITNHKMSFPVTMLITLLVPDGIDILIVQDTFNKLPAVQAA